jgi:hypothetical protein
MPSLTGDKDGQIRIADKSKGGLAGWFSGSSVPMAVGVPIDDNESIVSFETSRSASPDLGRRRPTLSSLDTSQKTPTAATSRFNFFSTKSTPSKQVQIPADLSDDILTLDIRSALFPNGEVDPFSPSSFKNLLQNAEGLLNKLQTAYKLRTLSLHELAADKEAQTEELEEAETRAKHLKLQLEDMAQRVMAHDEEMAKVVEELVREKQARAEEKEAREKSITLIKYHATSPSEASCSYVSEDLDVEARRRKHRYRRSDATLNSESSLEECESDDESAGAESVFTRSKSPSLASVSEASTPEMPMQAVFANVHVVTVGGPGSRNGPALRERAGGERPKQVQRKSTFQKILGGMSPKDEARQEDERGIADLGCRNCRGGEAGVAWDTVGLLRMENRGLKERVVGLETAVEGALDLVNGIGL